MDPKALSSSLCKFSAGFCNELDQKTSVCSPVSAEIALALLALGSRNQTHSELLAALGFTDDDSIRSTFSFLKSKLKEMEGTLKVATRVYLNKGEHDLRSEVKKDTVEVFDAGVEQIDFANGCAAADLINTWVAEQTNDKIKNMISSDTVDESTSVLLLNAIYFKGAWQIPFNKDLTQNVEFHVDSQTVIEVPMMKVARERFRFGQSEGLNGEILEVSYSTTETSMVIVRPFNIEGLQTVLQKLANGHDLMSEVENLHLREVNITIPKFKVESTINLKKILPKLGIKSIFDRSAEIDLLTSSAPLFVSDAIQKAYIDVNEEGTEAAACTKMRIRPKKGPLDFIADRPFLYLLIGHRIPFFIGTFRGDLEELTLSQSCCSYFNLRFPDRAWGTYFISTTQMAFFSARHINFDLGNTNHPVYKQRADVFRASLTATMDQKYLHSIANFALRFSNELKKDKTTICSPLSAETVLAMLALGCRGRARDELMKAIDISDDEALRSSFGSVTSSLKSMIAVKVNMANKIYLKKNTKIKPAVIKDMEEVFESSLEQLDFEETEAAADIINKWVAQRTNNLIKGIVSHEMFDENTSMVLVNALHFKGNWVSPFDVGDTEYKDFYVNKTTKTQVPQMYQSRVYFRYGVSLQLKAKLLKMTYEGYQSSMVFVLPDEIEGLDGMLQQLASGYNLLDDIIALKSSLVDVTIPKFKAEMTIDLKEVLTKMGIKSIFDPNSSDIDMLASKDRIYVSQAVQKAYIDVNEAGTEAAACSSCVFENCCSTVEQTLQFVADHPFLYLVIARGIILFVGTYHNNMAKI